MAEVNEQFPGEKELQDLIERVKRAQLIYANFPQEKVDEIFRAARSARGDDGDGDGGADIGQHFEIEAVLHAVGVYAVEHYLARALLLTAARPLDGVEVGGHPAALGIDAVDAAFAFGVDGEHDALVAILFRRSPDQPGIGDGARIDADFVRAAFEHAIEVLECVYAPSDGQRDEHLRRHFGEAVCEQLAPGGGGGNVVKHQLVRAGIVVVAGKIDGRGHIP